MRPVPHGRASRGRVLHGPAIVCCGLVLAVGGVPAAAGAFEGTRQLPLPRSHMPSEAHLAINPLNPQNVLVVAKDAGTRYPMMLRSWRSLDGGSTWIGAPFVDTRLEGRRVDASDPVAAFGPDGTAYYGALAFLYARHSWQSLILVGRSADGGRTFPGYGVAIRTAHRGALPGGIEEIPGNLAWHDKEWIVADQTAGPYSGSLYAAWDRVGGQRYDLMFARSTDQGATFTTPVVVERRSVFPQLTVRPDGTLDLLWIGLGRREPASMKVRHAFSTDGGATFSDPRTVASLGRVIDPLPTLAVDGSGRLLACWSQGRILPGAMRVRCSRSSDGRTWSDPVSVAPGGGNAVLQALPAAAAQGSTFWVAAYRSDVDAETTRVVLYRSQDGGATFTRYKTLASRNRGIDELAFAGDYMGLATTADHVLAAYVLSRSNYSARSTAFFTSLATP